MPFFSCHTRAQHQRQVPQIMSLLWLSLGLACLLGSACTRVVESGAPPSDYAGPISRVLEDNVHSLLQNSTYTLTNRDFRYQRSYGYSRLFQHLHRNGYRHDRLLRGALTDALLRRYDVLFINLLDVDRPDFTPGERAAVVRFVENGGGLFIIADHTNVYHHAERINPMVEPFGLRIRYETATDVGAHTLLGKGWLSVTNMRHHPVTEGVYQFGFYSGGPIDGPGGVAFTSAQGFGDKWDPNMKEGYFGNWEQDDDEPKESMALVQAVTYGKGRVVIVGDQNIFGNGTLLSLDNATLGLNTVEWLAKRDGETPPLRHRPWAGINIRFDAAASQCSMCRNRDGNYFTFYFNWNRHPPLSAHATMRPLPHTPDVLVWMAPRRPADNPTWQEATATLARDGQVMLVFDPAKMSHAQAHILERFELQTRFTTSDGAPLPIGAGRLQQEALKATLKDVTVDTSPNQSPFVLEECPAVRCPKHALISATDASGATCDLLCAFDQSPGRVLVSLAGAIFLNENMGKEHNTPNGKFRAPFLLQQALIREVRTSAAASEQRRQQHVTPQIAQK